MYWRRLRIVMAVHCGLLLRSSALTPRLLCVQLAFPSVGPVGQGKVLDAADIAQTPRVTVEEHQVAI